MSANKPHSDAATERLSAQLLRIARLAKRYRGRIVLGAFLVLLGTAATLVFPMVVAKVIDTAVSANDSRLLHMLSLAVLVLFVLRAAISFTGGYLLDATGERLVLDLKELLFAKLISLDLDFFHGQKVGDLTSRLTADTSAIRNVVTDTSVSVANQSFMLIGSVTVMATLNWRLTLLILLLAPATTFLSRRFGERLQNASKEVRERLADTSVVAQESISGIAVVKSHSRGAHETRRFRASLDRLLVDSLRSIRIASWFRAVVNLLTSLTTVAIFWYGGMQVFAKEITAGELVAFLFYVQNITQAFSGFAQLYANLQQAVGASSRAFELLSLEPTIRPPERPITPERVVGEVRFERVSFNHVSSGDILREFDLDVGAGEIVVLAGESGCGKTTAINLLPRLFDPRDGRITIDGHDVRTLSLDWLRQQISIVSQDVFLFGGTVAENLRYGRLDATDDEIVEAAIAAEAHEFIERMPQGYATEVGERGVRLSGGQRQRLALARAFLRKSGVLVLDEATSGVDSATEKKIYETVLRWCRSRRTTTIIVAHRSIAMQFADRIVMVANGAVVEHGRYRDLLERKGLFFDLINNTASVNDEIDHAH
ncbi:MAG: ABC transporter ATP-binding protein [Lysobacter sp.]|nr:ABC transporter ATP-binding protein [Lysobacter sp.]